MTQPISSVNALPVVLFLPIHLFENTLPIDLLGETGLPAKIEPLSEIDGNEQQANSADDNGSLLNRAYQALITAFPGLLSFPDDSPNSQVVIEMPPSAGSGGASSNSATAPELSEPPPPDYYEVMDNNGPPGNPQGAGQPGNRRWMARFNAHQTAGAPGGGDPGDPGGDELEQLPADEVKKAFLKLKEEVLKHCFYQLRVAWKLMGKVLTFSKAHPEYASRCYELLEYLIRYFTLTANVLVKLGFNLGIAFSAFDDTGLALGRSFAVVVGDTLASLIPWFFPGSPALEAPSLILGVAIITVTDNGFAHLTNSSNALPWLSNDFLNYQMRLLFLVYSNVWVLKHLYSGGLIRLASRLFHKHPMPLLVGDFIMKPILLYFSVAALVGTVPAVCVTCAPNPIANYSFPYSDYCPEKAPWVPWLVGCSKNATESD